MNGSIGSCAGPTVPDVGGLRLTSRPNPWPLQDNSDNLRGFEIEDPNGYVLYFGRPKP